MASGLTEIVGVPSSSLWRVRILQRIRGARGVFCYLIYLLAVTTPSLSWSALDYAGLPTPDYSSPLQEQAGSNMLLIVNDLRLHSGQSSLLDLSVAVFAELLDNLVLLALIQEF